MARAHPLRHRTVKTEARRIVISLPAWRRRGLVAPQLGDGHLLKELLQQLIAALQQSVPATPKPGNPINASLAPGGT